MTRTRTVHMGRAATRKADALSGIPDVTVTLGNDHDVRLLRADYRNALTRLRFTAAGYNYGIDPYDVAATRSLLVATLLRGTRATANIDYHEVPAHASPDHLDLSDTGWVNRVPVPDNVHDFARARAERADDMATYDDMGRGMS